MSEEWKKICNQMELNEKKLRFLASVAKVNVQVIDFVLSESEKMPPAMAVKEKIIIQVENVECEEIPFFAHFKEGEKHLFYPNGALKGVFHFSHGRLHGSSCFYAEDGTLLAESTFVDGLQEGTATWFYPSGARYSTQQYKNGLWQGKCLYYYENGNVRSEICYDEGHVMQSAHLYGVEGELKREIAVEIT